MIARKAVILAALVMVLSAAPSSGRADGPPAGGQSMDGPPADGAASKQRDAAAAIAAAHRKLDDALARALMSPFTAVEAYYLEPGRTALLGADGSGVRLDPPSPLPAMAAIDYRDGAFHVEPVAGAESPSIRAVTEEGDAAPGPGRPVAERRRLGEEVVGLGRFLLEMSPQSGQGRILVYDPDSPKKKAFTGLKWFDPNPALQVKAAFRPNPRPDPLVVGTSRGLEKEYWRAGFFEFTVEGSKQTLTALTTSASPAPGDDIFIPFRDATTGRETYGVGRYLNLTYRGNGAEYVLDFNAATNPNCNYSPHYNCPIPPKENVLSVPIRAGEMPYPEGH